MIINIKKYRVIIFCLFVSYSLLAIGNLSIFLPITYYRVGVIMKAGMLAYALIANIALICVVWLTLKEMFSYKGRPSNIFSFSLFLFSLVLFLLASIITYETGNLFVDLRFLPLADKYGWIFMTIYRLILDMISLSLTLLLVFLFCTPLVICRKRKESR